MAKKRIRVAKITAFPVQLISIGKRKKTAADRNEISITYFK
jgi:hypothetical protein